MCRLAYCFEHIDFESSSIVSVPEVSLVLESILIIVMINVRVFDLIAYINNPVVPGAITLLGAVT